MSSEPSSDFREHVLTVSEITRDIKEMFEGTWSDVWVQGEISNYKRHFSGHSYFTLKDAHAQLACVFWRGKQARLNFMPSDGMQVIIRGGLTIYEKQGKYQLNVDFVQPLGIGDLRLAFERMKQKLFDEGLFDSRWKKPIPQFPERIGVVTSPTGAAIKDIISVLSRRFPAVEVILNPVHVQGEGASEEICRAIKEFNEYGSVDLLIVGRGGGSLEDLGAFNEENVARAIFASAIPIISAVGHEIDFSIADFAADQRAPTPSAAAEMAAPDAAEVRSTIEKHNRRLYSALEGKINVLREKVRAIAGCYALNRPVDVVKQNSQRLDELSHRLITGFQNNLSARRSDAARLGDHLSALNPYAVLDRGYSICYRHPERAILKASSDISPGETISVQLAKGGLLGTVNQTNEGDERQNGSEKL